MHRQMLVETRLRVGLDLIHQHLSFQASTWQKVLLGHEVSCGLPRLEFENHRGRAV